MQSLRILLLDDDPIERNLTVKTLKKNFATATVTEVGNEADLERLLSQARFDLVISEYKLSWTDGLALHHQVRERYACIPFILLTASGNEEIAAAAIKSGIDDYLLKLHRDRLPAAITQSLHQAQQHDICHDEKNNAILCEKWDLAISRLTSDFAYSMRINEDAKPIFEWFTEPFKKFAGHIAQNHPDSDKPLYDYGLPVHPDDFSIVQKHFDVLLAGHENTSEYRVISNRGKTHHLRDHALPIRDWSNGKVVRIYGAIQDISLQRKAEEKLLLMQRAMDSSNNGIVITDRKEKDYEIIYANKSFLNMTGYSMEELLGRNPRFLQRNDTVQPGLEKLRDALKADQDDHAIVRNYRKNGELFWNEVYISPVYGKHRKITHYIGIQNDVTDRVDMELQLSNSEARLQAIFDNVMDGIIITNQNGEIESLNPSALKMFEYSSETLYGKPIDTLISTSSTKAEGVEFEKLTQNQGEAWGTKSNGNGFPIRMGLSRIKLDHHTLLIFTIQNISESKQAENALRKLSHHLDLAREEERSRIAREIHDELGSTLTALKMDLSQLKNKPPDAQENYQQKVAKMEQYIGDAIQTVKKIATDLRPSVLDHLGLLAAIEWQVNNFKKQSKIDCRLRMPEQLPEIEDQLATAIFRIIQESLTNIARHAHADRVTLDLGLRTDTLSLSITDNGRGMPASKMNDPDNFGLQSMYERARHFGGALDIVSRPNRGCSVLLTIPLANHHRKENHD